MGKPNKSGNRKLINKRGRLIVRNLPFTVTDQSLKDHFSKCGDINEVLILKKPDGKLVGCGFVQFVTKQNAAKAIHNLSGKPFQGRTIIVDWAVQKEKFVQINAKQTKKENETSGFSDNKSDVNEFISDHTDHDGKDEEDDDFQEPAGDKNSGSETEIDNENSEVVSDLVKSKPQPSHDIPEGKTIFLKNVPFSLNNEELKEFIEQFGPVHYAVVCIDPLTEHSKGTAFVKFKNEESVQKCLSAEKVEIHGSTVEVFKALSKNDIKNKDEQSKLPEKKDSRNLYLVKEGVVTAGSRAAEGVSDADMKKRLELEMWKSNMLRNLNMFVSRTRLIIHNLPASYDDANLRSLLKKYAPPNSRIMEAKVMKNLRNFDEEGKPTSKGYGFVSFTNYEHALAVLRAVNNKPDIFNKNKRPIVSFSIENRVMVNAKQRRMEKSKLNNPLCPDYKKPKFKRNSEQSSVSRDNVLYSNNNNNNSYRKQTIGHSKTIAEEQFENEDRTFEGNKAKEGDVKLRSKMKMKAQNELHRQNVMERKYEMKKKKQLLEKRNEKKREAKVKPKAKKFSRDDKEFNNLVDQYKKRIMPHVGNLKKWYET